MLNAVLFILLALQWNLIVGLPVSWLIIWAAGPEASLIWFNGIGGIILVSASAIDPGRRIYHA